MQILGRDAACEVESFGKWHICYVDGKGHAGRSSAVGMGGRAKEHECAYDDAEAPGKLRQEASFFDEFENADGNTAGGEDARDAFNGPPYVYTEEE